VAETIRAYGMVPLHADQAPVYAPPPPAPAYAPTPAAYAPPAYAPAPAAAPPAQPVYQPDTAPVYGFQTGTFVPLGQLNQAPSAPPQATSIWAQLSAALGTPAGGPAPARGVPYMSQYTPAGREYGYTNGNANCGPTTAAMIARAIGYGGNLGDAQLINYLGSIGKTTEAGTSVNGIAAMAQTMGLPAQIRPGGQVGWIADQLRAGKFVIANGDYFAMRPHEDPSRTSGHYVLLTGLDAYGNFLVLDPADSRARSVSEDELRYYITSNTNGGYGIAVG